MPHHTLGEAEIGFEDGTIDYLGLPAIEMGLRHIESVGMPVIHRRVDHLTRRLLAGLPALRHRDGSPLVRLYGPADDVDRGGTIPFNLLDPAGGVVDFWAVEAAAAERRISVRTGCFCNPGSSETARGLTAADMERVFALRAAAGLRGPAGAAAGQGAGRGAGRRSGSPARSGTWTGSSRSSAMTADGVARGRPPPAG